jgi:hypothetical protein
LQSVFGGQAFGNSLQPEATGIELKYVADYRGLFRVHHAPRAFTHLIAVGIDAAEHVNVAITEHPPAHYKATFHLVPVRFVGAAGRVFTVGFVPKGPQRRHRLVHGIPGCEAPAIHVGPDFDARLRQFLYQRPNTERFAAQCLLFGHD